MPIHSSLYGSIPIVLSSKLCSLQSPIGHTLLLLFKACIVHYYFWLVAHLLLTWWVLCYLHLFARVVYYSILDLLLLLLIRVILSGGTVTYLMLSIYPKGSNALFRIWANKVLCGGSHIRESYCGYLSYTVRSLYMGKWLLLRSLTPRPLIEGGLYDKPVLVSNTLWYCDGTVYEVIRKVGSVNTYIPMAVGKKSTAQVLCDMINDLPLATLPKYLDISLCEDSLFSDGSYLSHLVKHRLVNG